MINHDANLNCFELSLHVGFKKFMGTRFTVSIMLRMRKTFSTLPSEPIGIRFHYRVSGSLFRWAWKEEENIFRFHYFSSAMHDRGSCWCLGLRDLDIDQISVYTFSRTHRCLLRLQSLIIESTIIRAIRLTILSAELTMERRVPDKHLARRSMESKSLNFCFELLIKGS